MSQDARTRAVIDEAVARAIEPLTARLDAVEERLAAVQSDGGATAATEPKRPPAGRTAKTRPQEAGGAADPQPKAQGAKADNGK